MADKTQTYLTTERAGFTVAGRRVPGEWRDQTGKDGNPVRDEKGAVQAFRPQIGFKLDLLDMEAEYELAQGTIVLARAVAIAVEPAEAAAPVAEPVAAKSRSKGA